MKNKIAIGLVALFVLASGLFMLLVYPFKITDPSDPRFAPTQISLGDYKSISQLDEALNKIFPIGTSREEVDGILVKVLDMAFSDNEPQTNGGYLVDYVKKQHGFHTHGTGRWQAFGYGDYSTVVTVSFTNENKIDQKIDVYLAGVQGAPHFSYRPLANNTGR